ncbi:iron-containing alcohol dehydrogenase family protein [Paenibacillus campi]|uniref:iron-containing alcohol dehydrogenase family protein n=1 Tax=Paenibacillus campi TaxID=3106031 RepID=UPI002AFE6487|nr:iron-containing alcohol dehydrogenase family protein [Paenibacillus sp. SGZ-1014]
MVTIKAPSAYYNEPGLLQRSGNYIRPFGSQALIVGGQTALSIVGEQLYASLHAAGIRTEINVFTGQCTAEEIEAYTAIARQVNAELIIGVGGGKVLDLSKAVAEDAGLPIVTIPTVPATCAAWSALTVLYDQYGQAAGYRPLLHSPELVLADPSLLAGAPRRYLAAGIGDTLVKWYEFAVNLNGNSGSVALRTSVATARLALDILERHATDVYEQAGQPGYTPDVAFTEVTDAIIWLAGLVGSIQDGSVHAAIAHGLHDSLTFIEDTHQALHGEKVAFGLLTQWVLEGKEGEQLEQLATWLQTLELPITLAQLGITDDAQQSAARIAQRFVLREGAADQLDFAVTTAAVEAAIVKADALGQALHERARSATTA